jgi:uncharacterized protein (DUF697 family)
MYWSIGLGAIPVPVVDAASVTVAQYKMVRDLAKHYGCEATESQIKEVLSAVVAGLGSNFLAYGAVGQTIKAVPGVGTLFGMIAMPVTSGSLTYALGQLFIEHFEKGGTILDFDATAAFPKRPATVVPVTPAGHTPSTV